MWYVGVEVVAVVAQVAVVVVVVVVARVLLVGLCHCCLAVMPSRSDGSGCLRYVGFKRVIFWGDKSEVAPWWGCVCQHCG
jgi:hypothetical protein